MAEPVVKTACSLPRDSAVTCYLKQQQQKTQFQWFELSLKPKMGEHLKERGMLIYPSFCNLGLLHKWVQ